VERAREAAAYDLGPALGRGATGVETRIVLSTRRPARRARPTWRCPRRVGRKRRHDAAALAANGGDSRLFNYVAMETPGAHPPRSTRGAASHAPRASGGTAAAQARDVAAMVLLCGVVAWRVDCHRRRAGARADRQGAAHRSGDFSAPIVLPGRSELSDLARETNAMARSSTRSRASSSANRRRACAALEQHCGTPIRLTTGGKLASGLAHELGTPLNVVSGPRADDRDRPDTRPPTRSSAPTRRDRRPGPSGWRASSGSCLDFARRRRRAPQAKPTSEARPRHRAAARAARVETRVRVAGPDPAAASPRGSTPHHSSRCSPIW
jgi:hypothetical protein